jgi:hypothetical protein
LINAKVAFIFDMLLVKGEEGCTTFLRQLIVARLLVLVVISIEALAEGDASSTSLHHPA